MWNWLHRGAVCCLLLTAGIFVVNFGLGYELGWDAIYTYSEQEHFTFGQCDIILKRDGLEVVWEENFRAYKKDLIFFDKSLLGVGVRYYEDHVTCGSAGSGSLNVSLSSWTIAILTAIYPAIFFIRNDRRRQLKSQALEPCGQCGYDLYGNESGVCPECGRAGESTV